MARAASLESSWLPSYAWWPPSAEYAVSAFLVPYHAAVEPHAEFEFHLRGYNGSNQPVWTHDAGTLRFGDQRTLLLDDLGVASASSPHGGILEIHTIRRDEPPRKGTGWIAMLLDAQGRRGGGYLIPSVPIRGAAKMLVRDDLQVVPGVVLNRETDTELVILNPIDETTDVRLVVSSVDGLVAEGELVRLAPWSSWTGSLKAAVPRARKLLEPSAGIGSLAMFSSHRTLPYFGFRRSGHPVVSLDHAAPIFGAVQVKRRIASSAAR
jgi:hypothetical protein